MTAIGLLEYAEKETISVCGLNLNFLSSVFGIALSIILDESARAAPGISKRY